MFAAILSDQVGVVEYLASSHANPNRGANGTTPLITAIAEGRSNVVALLLRHGADLELRDKNGLTPLVSAVARNQFECVKLLLRAGADVSATDLQGLTPLQIATTRRYVNIVDILKRYPSH